MIFGLKMNFIIKKTKTKKTQQPRLGAKNSFFFPTHICFNELNFKSNNKKSFSL